MDEYEMIEYFVQSFDMENLIEMIDENQMTNQMKADISLESDLKERGKNALSEEDADVANAQFALNHQDGADPTETMMMAMYMLVPWSILIKWKLMMFTALPLKLRQ